MQTQIHKKTIILMMMIMLVSWVSASEVYFEVSGWVKKEDVSVRRALVTIFEGENTIAEVRTNRWGNFNLDLPGGREYIISISAEGVMEKRIVFNTVTQQPLDAAKDYFVEFVVDVFTPESSHESAFLYHQLIFVPSEDEFIYLQPIVSEHLMIDAEDSTPAESVECCANDQRIS